MLWRPTHRIVGLEWLEALKSAIVAPSHGSTGDGTILISGYRACMTEVRDRAAAEERAGRTVEQTI